MVVKKREQMLREAQAKRATTGRATSARRKRDPMAKLTFGRIYNRVIDHYPTLERNYIEAKREAAEKRKMIAKVDDIKKTKNDIIHE